MKGKQEQQSSSKKKGTNEESDSYLGISNKDYLELVLGNKRITRNSVMSLNPSIPQGGTLPSPPKQQSDSVTKEKKKAPKDNSTSKNPNKPSKPSREEKDRSQPDDSRKKSSHESSTSQNKRANNDPRKKAPKNKEPQDIDINIEIPKPIKLFPFETSFPQLRNEFPMGLNLLKHRNLKIVHKDYIDGKKTFFLYNAFISKRNKNDYSQISIEYFDSKLIQNPNFASKLMLDNSQERSFILTQDPGVVEVGSEEFKIVFKNIERASLSFHKLSMNRKHGYWPVVILNNCSQNVTTKEIFGSATVDDQDYLKDYLQENIEPVALQRGESVNKGMKDGTGEEGINFFDDDDDDANELDDNTDSLFSEENSLDNVSSESIEDVFKNDDVHNGNHNQSQIEEEKTNGFMNGEDHEKEREYYEKMIKGLEEPGNVLVWFVGTSHYEIRKISEIKPVTKEVTNHLVEVAKNSELLQKVVELFSEYTKNYNISCQESDYSLPVSNKIIKENLHRVIYAGSEDKALVPMKFLSSENRMRERKSENYTILRNLDDYSLHMIKNNDSKTVIKAFGFIPPIHPDLLENLENISIAERYNKEEFIRTKLLTNIYPESLIDPNQKWGLKFNNSNHEMQLEEISFDRNSRCKTCNYILDKYPYQKCNKCNEPFHEHCIKKNSNSRALKPTDKNKKWVCENCKNCTYCLSGHNRESLVFCLCCDEAYHTTCVNYLHKNYKVNKNAKLICPDCAVCHMCDKEIPNFSEKNIFENAVTFCNECIDIRDRHEYCPICNRGWDFPVSQIKEDNEMIECQCKMWIHKFCDPDLTKELFKEFSTSGRVYYCPNCRKVSKNKQIVDFIQILSELDESKVFALPVDEKAVPGYRSVINHPMDFQTMTQKANNSDYLADPFILLKKDFDLIHENAIIFNMPKSSIHLQAKRLKQFGNKAFAFFKDLLECPHKEFLKFSRKLSPGYYSIQFKKEIEEFMYDILFEDEGTNPNTRIRVLDNNKMANPTKKNQNKEILIEITGLNYLLTDKFVLDKSQEKFLTKPDLLEKKPKEETESNISGESEQIKDEVPVEDEMTKILKAPKESVVLVEELLNQNSKNKPFFYFDPVIIQFTNPNLVNKDICYLCGSFGKHDCFIHCSSCQESYHYFCISKSYNDVEKYERIKSNQAWQCPKCKLCQKCHNKSESHSCLICETCDNLYHLGCIYPQISVLFPSEWRCEDCFKCSRCGTNKIFSNNLNAETGNIQPEFCENFKWCYECGIKMAYFKFCKICKKYCQKSITNSKNDSRSLQYIDPAEDSIECTICKFKYHFSCYEDEDFQVNDYDNFVCYNCQVNDDELFKRENELNEKAELIIAKRRNVKQLMRICESIYTMYFQQNVKTEYSKENSSKALFEYVIEDYNFLTSENHIKTMVENYKLLNAATKLLNTKHSASVIFGASKAESSTLVIKDECIEEYLINKQPCWDFWINVILPQTDPNRPLPVNFEYSELIDVIFTDTSREMYDYLNLIKIVDSAEGWFNLPDGILRGVGGSFFDSIGFKIASCLYQRQEILKIASFNPKRPCKLGKLFTLVSLLEMNDIVMFFPFYTSYNGISVPAEFDSILAACYEISIPYSKGFDDIKNFVLLEKNPKRVEKTALVGLTEIVWSDLRSRKAQLSYQFKIHKTTPPKESAMNIEEEAREESQMLEEFSSGSKYYEDFKHLMFCEMVGLEIIKRRLRAWFEYKRELKQAQAKSRILGMPTKLSMRALDQKAQNEKAAANNNVTSSQTIPVNKVINLEAPPVKAHTKATVEVVGTLEEDVLLPSSMSEIECICCKVKGDRKLSGRLIFVDCDQWVHTNCALWSYDVFENIEGGLVNFVLAHKRSLSTICTHCQKSGATIFCFSKKCQHKYHFHCAFFAKCSFLTCKKFYCKSCSMTKNLNNKINTDFSTNRRIYIVRNQSLFYMENSKISRQIKEKPIEMLSGTFNRIGNSTVILAKKCNTGARFLINDYSIVKMLNTGDHREAFFLNIKLNDGIYNFTISPLEDTFLQNKKNLLKPNFTVSAPDAQNILNNAEIFFKKLSEVIIDPNNIFASQIEARDKIWKKELLGEFLALFSADVRRWLKTSVIVEDDVVSKKPEYPSFKEFFYNENIDELNPFERLERVNDIYTKLKPRIEEAAAAHRSNETERAKNPKEKGFGIKNTRAKISRTPDNLGTLGLVPDELIHENSLNAGIDYEFSKHNKIQSQELETKLKQDYVQHKKKPSKVLVAPSPIHKYGLFAVENLGKHEIVIEYCGELVRNKIADLREEHYKNQGFGDCFMFRADKDSVVDASFKGNQARYLNHCCDPNCGCIIIEIEGQPKIIIYAKRPIYAGEELTYDYQFDVEIQKIQCTCGAKNCLGRLN